MNATSDAPSYQGCFTDNLTRDMDKWLIAGDTTLTIDKCYEGCLKNNYGFMGVQVWLNLFLIFITFYF